MNTLRRNLKIAFSLVSPEDVIADLKERGDLCYEKQAMRVNLHEMSEEYYIMASRKLLDNYSIDEIRNLYQEMNSLLESFGDIPKSLFQLLVRYGNEVLELDNQVPLVKRSELMSYRAISLDLGQDIFTTSFLAYKTFSGVISARNKFDWNTVIDTNDGRLRAILDRGIAENHFHLAGSVPLFSLSWIALMNHPQIINYYFGNPFESKNPFSENRSVTLSFSGDARQLNWSQSLRYAAWIRAQLFKAVNSMNADGLTEFFKMDFDFVNATELSNLILWLRMEYGARFLCSDYERKCLDYAIKRQNRFSVENSKNRLLSGERELMYQCFLACFNHRFDHNRQNLFYLYLLLKVRFRSELIQVNREKGFANFSIYQSRKALFWGNMPEYWAESQRLAVNSAFENNAIQDLEMRFRPADTAGRIYSDIMEEDNHILFADNNRVFSGDKRLAPDQRRFFSDKSVRLSNTLGDSANSGIGKTFPFFYTLHFIKEQLRPPASSKGFMGLVSPRNNNVRMKAQQCTLALADALEKSDYLCSRVRGIDAASFEINCRPEVFATEFRFLKRFIPNKAPHGIFSEFDRMMPKLGISYHVGEDFLDIADGLRAIDETLRFLNLSRGDRLGHALALGIDPAVHYRVKGNFITLSKQDMLDNLVWIIMRSTEFGIPISLNLRDMLRNKSKQLLAEIYEECCRENKLNLNLEEYYSSWKLRGDHPDYYKEMRFNPYYHRETRFAYQHSYVEKYRQAYINGAEDDILRRLETPVGLLHFYHYGFRERLEGLKPCVFHITFEYIRLMSELQKHMRSLIAEKGICIECNLSSNHLIGTIERYENHPIFTFNHHGLHPDENPSNICVSINTDDQGVFDTSLENEYALLTDCMAKMKDANNRRVYSDETIYEYVDYVRKMGLSQTFPQPKSVRR